MELYGEVVAVKGGVLIDSRWFVPPGAGARA